MDRSVVAVIVTYNRLECLRRALAAVMAQSLSIREVILVDNKSTDETPRFLEEQARRENPYPLRVISMAENEGGAGGFARGMEEAYESGADLIWLMDDDCVADPDALARLVNGFDDLAGKLGEEQTEPGFVCSNVMWKDDTVCEMNIPKAAWDWNRFYRPGAPYVGVAHCSFVSVLVNARVIPLVGYPVREFFIWFDDVEFTLRVAERWPGFAILDSLVTHEIPQNKGVSFSDVNAQNVWKFRYGIRNEAAYLASKPLGAMKALRLIATQIGRMARSKVPLSLRLQILRSGLSGLTFGYKSKIRFPPPRGARNDTGPKAAGEPARRGLTSVVEK